MVFRGNRDGILPFHSSQGSPKHIEASFQFCAAFISSSNVHSSPWMLCSRERVSQLQNLFPVNSSIPERLETDVMS